MLVFRKFPEAGVVALYDEAAGGGAHNDIDAPRNAPAKTPEDHLDKIYFHSHFDLLEVLASATVTISHASFAAGAGVSGTTTSATFNWSGTSSEHTLLDLTSYGLSQAPFALVSQGDNILWPGMPVQTDASGRGRYGTVYTTATAVKLFETSSRSGTSMPSASIDYDVLVFKDPEGDTDAILEGFDPATLAYKLGRGRFSTLKRYLQVAPGGSPLGFAVGRTIDLKNGAPRAIRPDGTYFDPIPASITVRVNPGTGAYGPSIAYNGTFTGDGAVEVQAP